MDKSDANLAALQARSGQDLSAVERMAFQNVRLSPIYEHCSNDRAWPPIAYGLVVAPVVSTVIQKCS